MPLFQCQKCGCVDNSATGHYWRANRVEKYDWTGLEEFKGKILCAVCGPRFYASGAPTEFGVWHKRFKRDFLPLGQFEENSEGGLTNKENGDRNYTQYYIPAPL
jgi:hypothetical protein